VCFGTRGVLWCKSHDLEIVQDDGGVSNMGGKENGGVHGKKGYIYSCFCVLIVKAYKTAEPSSCTTTRNLMNEEP